MPDATTDATWRRFFAGAALFNLIASLGPLFAPAVALDLFGMTPLPDHLFVQLAGVLVLTYGLGYWMVSRNLEAREIVLLGIIGKCSVVVIIVWAWLHGRAGAAALAAGSGDLLFSIFFGVFLATRQPAATKNNRFT